MEISAAGSAAQAQATTRNQIAISVLRKSLDITAEQGAELVKAMSQTSGVGQRVDQYA
jgi:hypothetical protein